MSGMLPLARSLVTSVASDILDDDAVEENLARPVHIGALESFCTLVRKKMQIRKEMKQLLVSPAIPAVKAHIDIVSCVDCVTKGYLAHGGFTLFVERLHSQNQRRRRCVSGRVYLHNVVNACNVFM